MFHKVKNVNALPDYKLSVQFCEGVTKIYDVAPLFEKYSFFLPLKAASCSLIKLFMLKKLKNEPNSYFAPCE